LDLTWAAEKANKFKRILTQWISEIPTTLYERYKNVTIAIDIMYVNKIAFFVTISRDICFATSEMIPDAQVNTSMKVIKHVLNVYKARHFKVTHILADGQFEHLSNEIASLGTMPNIVAQGEHVPEIEWHIRTLKEQVQAIYNTLPFKSISKRMLIELIYNCTFWLNRFPNTEGVSASMSPRSIITGYTYNLDRDMNEKYGEHNNNYILQPCKPCDYSHLHGTLEDTALIQNSLNHCLETFSNAGIKAVQKELRQLHD
jgi:hypothetical protein